MRGQKYRRRCAGARPGKGATVSRRRQWYSTPVVSCVAILLVAILVDAQNCLQLGDNSFEVVANGRALVVWFGVWLFFARAATDVCQKLLRLVAQHAEPVSSSGLHVHGVFRLQDATLENRGDDRSHGNGHNRAGNPKE